MFAGFLTGCSYLQSYFPDKERDYQYTAEIPMMDWPADLRSNQSAADTATGSSTETLSSSANLDSNGVGAGTENAGQSPADASSSDTSSESAPAAASEKSSSEVVPADESDTQDAVSSVEIVKYDDGESRLRLGAGFSKAWRVLNKALSRNTIEVTERNHDKGEITIQYDPNEKKAKDDSFMDEISFIFKGININDKEYTLKLEEHDEQTDVIPLNDERLPMLNDEAAVRLLKVLADTAKADLADKAK